MASPNFQTAEASREVGNGLVRSSTCHRDPASSFDYLLREPRRARRLRRMNITAGIVALVTMAAVLYACV
jgi:hypothetical protein